MLELFPELDPEPTPAPCGYVRVAVERALDAYPSGLVYGIPEGLKGLGPGQRVRVPLGRATALVPGIVVEAVQDPASEGLDPGKIRNVAQHDQEMPPLPGELIQLARWISAYYACPIGMTLAGVVPGAVKRGVGRRTRQLLEPTARERPARLGKRQKAVLDFVESLPATDLPVDARRVIQEVQLGNQAPIRRLLELDLLTSHRVSDVEATWRMRAEVVEKEVEPTAAQAAAIAGIGETLGGGFSTHLLFGVTGSGKTEVYLRLLKEVLASGRTGLILVPEIALAAQTVSRVLARFPTTEAAVLHSGLTAAQRNHAWSRIASGDARLVLGARSAIFAPIPEKTLGLVVVDEEHDASFKQDKAPRYHGRDAAIRRAQLAECPIVLGSATPSLETWHNAGRGRTRLHRLPDRAPGLALPKVEIIDFAEERRHFGADHVPGVRLIGPRLASAIAETLSHDGQVLLLLNRRGYANYIACADHTCGWVMACEHCDACMVCHQDLNAGRRERWVRCHHCEAEQQLPRTCPLCSKRVTVFGQGTQRVEEELQRLHPALAQADAMVRVDSDTMHANGDFDAILDRFRSGKIRMLYGTQMIAKGLDIPGVRLVGVVNADTAINLPDFRASERTFQLVAQVVGRTGRGQEAGRAFIQTFQPDAPAIQRAAEHDFEAFAEKELAERAQFGLPPHTRMARLVVRDAGETTAWNHAELLAQRLEPIARAQEAQVRPPAACPIARVAGRYRVQLEVLGPTPASLSRLLSSARSQDVFAAPLALGEAVAVDVDPVALL